jgi:hypothetical protein
MTATHGGQQRLYRSLLHLYPADYRAGYTDQMVQLFGDQLRETGTARTWLRALTDLAATAASEHLRRNRTMAHSISLAPTPASRLLGLLGVLGGAFLLAAFVLEMSPDVMNVRLVLFNLGAIAVVLAVHRRQSPVSPRLALAAAIPALVTNAAYLVIVVRLVAQPGEPGPGDYGQIFAWAAGAMWLSDLWFGLVTLWLGAVSRISALALVVGSVFAFLRMGLFFPIDRGTLLATVILGGIAVHGLAWILLGAEVAFRRRAACWY